jgi:hypothetical protein
VLSLYIYIADGASPESLNTSSIQRLYLPFSTTSKISSTSVPGIADTTPIRRTIHEAKNEG